MKKLRIKDFLRASLMWSLFLVLLLSALGFMIVSLLSGVMLLTASMLFFPTFNKWINEKWGFVITPGSRVFSLLVCFLAFVFSLNASIDADLGAYSVSENHVKGNLTESEPVRTAAAGDISRESNGSPGIGELTLNETVVKLWGRYKIRPVLFSEEEWEFFIIVVPAGTGQGTLIDISKAFFALYPNTRVRFFSNTDHIQQYVDRDRYFNDTEGRVPEVDFPDSKWVQSHLLGNINNRSSVHDRSWMLEDRYGNKISFLP